MKVGVRGSSSSEAHKRPFGSSECDVIGLLPVVGAEGGLGVLLRWVFTTENLGISRMAAGEAQSTPPHRTRLLLWALVLSPRFLCPSHHILIQSEVIWGPWMWTWGGASLGRDGASGMVSLTLFYHC